MNYNGTKTPQDDPVSMLKAHSVHLISCVRQVIQYTPSKDT